MVHDFDGILKKVVVKVFVNVQKEVKGYFLRIEDFLNPQVEGVNISVFILTFDEGR